MSILEELQTIGSRARVPDYIRTMITSPKYWSKVTDAQFKNEKCQAYFEMRKSDFLKRLKSSKYKYDDDVLEQYEMIAFKAHPLIIEEFAKQFQNILKVMAERMEGDPDFSAYCAKRLDKHGMEGGLPHDLARSEPMDEEGSRLVVLFLSPWERDIMAAHLLKSELVRKPKGRT